METKFEFRSVQELVVILMSTDERCRNDDKWLTYRVMKHFTNIFIPFEDFAKMPSFETVKRVRAKVQNDKGLLLPTDPAVVAKRQSREQDVADWAVRE